LAPNAIRFTVVPAQMVGLFGDMVVGLGHMVMLTVSILLQPIASVPVTVYMIDVLGVVVILLPDVAESPVEGLQM
jgi:hypothetical protein